MSPSHVAPTSCPGTEQINHYQFQKTENGYRSTKGVTFKGLVEVVDYHSAASDKVAVPLGKRIPPADSSS